MKTKEQIQSTFRHLAHEIREKRAVLFVGSGFSVNAKPQAESAIHKMHSWDSLKQRFGEELGMNTIDVQSTPAPRLIQIYQDSFDLRRRNSIIREAIPDEKVLPSVLHAQMLAFDWSAIVTTNIDTLLERSIRESGSSCTPVVRESDLSRLEGGVPIYKIHGSFEDETTWVFSESEYHLNVKPLFIDKLRTIFAESTVVFVGYSLNDPDLDAVLYHIQNRIGHYQKDSFLVTAVDPDRNIPYWKGRKVDLITNAEMEELRSVSQDASQSAGDVDHELFLGEFVKVLGDAVKGDPLGKDRQASWLWKETRLAPAVKNKCGDALETIQKVSGALQQSLSTQSQKTKREKITELVRNAEWQENIKAYCQAIQEISKIREQPEFSPFSLELDEVIFSLDGGTPDDGQSILSLLSMAFAVANEKGEIDPVARDAIQTFDDALWRRITAGRLPGVSDFHLAQTIKLIRRFRPQGRQQPPYQRNVTNSLRLIRYVVGNLIHEKRLRRILSVILRRSDLSDQQRAIVEYRRSITGVYLQHWSEIEDLLNRTDRIVGWDRKWTAFLCVELGRYEEAMDIYKRILEGSIIRKERYLAAQSLEILENALDAGSYNQWLETWKSIQGWRERIQEIEDESFRAGERFGECDFVGRRYTSLHSQLMKSALEQSTRKGNTESRSYPAVAPVVRVFEEFNLHWLNGVPLLHLDRKDLRTALKTLLESPADLGTLLELKSILPIFRDFDEENIHLKIAILAWNNPMAWRKLQKDLLAEYSNLCDYVLSGRFPARENQRSPFLDRFDSTTALIGHASLFFSKGSVNTAKELLSRILQRWGSLFPSNRSTKPDAIKDLFRNLFSLISIEERARFLERIPIRHLFSHSGLSMMESVSEHLKQDLWEMLSDQYKKDLHDEIVRALPLEPLMSLQFLTLWSAQSESHPLRQFFDRGLETYKQERVKQLEAELQSIDGGSAYAGYIDDRRRELEAVRQNDDHVFRDYRQFLPKGTPSDSLLRAQSLIDWITQMETALDGTLSSNALEPLTSYVRGGISEAERPLLDSFLEKVFTRIERSLRKGGGDVSWKRELLRPIGIYFASTNQIERWFSLWERFCVFDHGYSRPGDAKRFRISEEQNGPEIGGYSERLFYLYLRLTHESDRLRLLEFLYEISHSMETVVESDMRWLRLLWNTNPILKKYAEVPILLLSRMLALDPDKTAPLVPRCLAILLQTDSLEIIPKRAKLINRLLDETQPYWEEDSDMRHNVEATREKIRTLDFPQASEEIMTHRGVSGSSDKATADF